MKQDKLEKITAFIIRLLVRNGYTQKDSGDLLIAMGQLIKGVRDEKSTETNSEKGSGLFVHHDRLSNL